MRKIGILIGTVLSLLVIAKMVAFAQTPTRTPTPTRSPTVVVPSGAPSTGGAELP